MDPVSITITATEDGFTVAYDGTEETFDAIDLALQEARTVLLGADKESESEDMEHEGMMKERGKMGKRRPKKRMTGPDEDMMQEEMDFEEGFKKARGMPL